MECGIDDPAKQLFHPQEVIAGGRSNARRGADREPPMQTLFWQIARDNKAKRQLGWRQRGGQAVFNPCTRGANAPLRTRAMPHPDEQNQGRRGSLIALVVVVVLFAVGWALVHELYQSEKLQDCLLSGRTNCAPIETPAH